MQRKAVSGIMTALVLVSMLTLAFNIQPVRASGTIYIRPDGTVEGTDKIQQDGDIYTFTENVYDEIVVERSNMMIDGNGCTLQGSGGGTGLYLSTINNVTIKSTNITGFSTAIYLSGTSSCAVSENNITTNNYDGILLVSSSNTTVFGNNVTNNASYGIEFYGSSANNISGNNITTNNCGIYLYASANNTIAGNNITTNKDCGVFLHFGSNNAISGNNITANKEHGIYIFDSAHNSMVGNNITTNNYIGIYIYGVTPTNNSIVGNNITANKEYGVYIFRASNNSIHGNNVTNHGFGITLEHSSNDNNICENNITDNEGWGINLYDSSSNNNICRNNVTDNDEDGISLDMSSSSNSIHGNNVAGNLYGIRLWYSPDNSLSENNVASNEHGIYIRQSSNNIFHHNNFVNNLCQVSIYASMPGETPPTNVWDDGYPSGGNYWSDYAGIDSNEDGVGDTPYVLDEDNQDRYPLMNPWRERTVGVKVGDWAKYAVDTSWTGVLDPRLEMLSETEWASIEVTDVQGTVVTFTGTSHFKNGSELTAPGVKWDIAPTGSFGFIFWFIGSNLQAGDKVYPSGAVTIDETVTRACCGVPRQNNHLNESGSGSIVPGPPYDLTKLDCYWDQATGILTEESLKCSTEDLSSTLSIHLKMVDTNLWEATNPTDTTQQLMETTKTMNLQKGTENSLTSKLEAVIHLLDIGNENGARHKLVDFISQVEALRGKKLTNEQADLLISEAQRIIGLING